MLQKQISGGTGGIPVKYLSGKLLTVVKKNQLWELGFILSLTVLVRLSESVIQMIVRWVTAFCPVEKWCTTAIIFNSFPLSSPVEFICDLINLALNGRDSIP